MMDFSVMWGCCIRTASMMALAERGCPSLGSSSVRRPVPAGGVQTISHLPLATLTSVPGPHVSGSGGEGDGGGGEGVGGGDGGGGDVGGDGGDDGGNGGDGGGGDGGGEGGDEGGGMRFMISAYTSMGAAASG